jgi:hypothetical protein
VVQVDLGRICRKAWASQRRSPGATDAPALHDNTLGNVIADAKCLVVAWTYLESNRNHAAKSASGESPLLGPQDKNPGN